MTPQAAITFVAKCAIFLAKVQPNQLIDVAKSGTFQGTDIESHFIIPLLKLLETRKDITDNTWRHHLLKNLVGLFEKHGFFHPVMCPKVMMGPKVMLFGNTEKPKLLVDAALYLLPVMWQNAAVASESFMSAVARWSRPCSHPTMPILVPVIMSVSDETETLEETSAHYEDVLCGSGKPVSHFTPCYEGDDDISHRAHTERHMCDCGLAAVNMRRRRVNKVFADERVGSEQFRIPTNVKTAILSKKLISKYGARFVHHCNQSALNGLFPSMFENMIKRKSMAILPGNTMYGPICAAQELLLVSGVMDYIETSINIWAASNAAAVRRNLFPFGFSVDIINKATDTFFDEGHESCKDIDRPIYRFFALLLTYQITGRWVTCEWNELESLINFAFESGLLCETEVADIRAYLEEAKKPKTRRTK